MAADLFWRHPGETLQVAGAARALACERQERGFSHDLERRLVHALGPCVAVRKDGLKDGGLCGGESARARDAPECGRVRPRAAGVAPQARQPGELLECLRPVPGLGQRLELLVAQPQEVVRVEPRIVQLFRCQGAAFPVGTLILLAQRHAEVGVENGGQANLRPPQCARRAHGVEDVRELETVAAPEADDVVFGGMKHLLLRGIGEDGCQSTQVWQPDRINDEVSIRRGELDEAHALPMALTPLSARGESRSYEGSTQSIRRTTLTRMAMGTRETDQPPLWIATSDLPTSPGHPFYARLTTLLDGHHFDRFVEGLCDRFYAPVMGRPSLAPGRYFRLLLVGYFEGIDSERGIAWRATDSLAVRSFLRLAVDEAPPDHSTIARTRRLIDLETHRTVFTWVQQRLVEAGRLKGKTIAIDATTLEANAAMRSIVRRDTGESYQAFLAGLAKASGIETPTREGLARLDRKRKKKTSNTDWTNPHDPDAKVTKMKDGRTHLAHKAEHAVDMETGAIVAVTLQGADVGDTTTIIETAIAAAEQVEDAQANVDDRQSLEEIVGEKGYHSNQTLIDLDAVGIRSYVSEPDRGRRDWSKDPEARAPVYGNRRRMRGRRGRRLMRQRGERIERSFAHLYDTGGMRRTHLRGHTNILKRLLIHAGGFNLGLVMRHLIGIGTPRGLQGRVAAVLATLGVLMGVVRRRLTTISSSHRLIPAVRGRLASLATFAVNSSAAITCTTGCYMSRQAFRLPA